MGSVKSGPCRMLQDAMTKRVCLSGLGGGDRHWGPWYTGAPVQPLGQVCHPTFPVGKIAVRRHDRSFCHQQQPGVTVCVHPPAGSFLH